MDSTKKKPTSTGAITGVIPDTTGTLSPKLVTHPTWHVWPTTAEPLTGTKSSRWPLVIYDVVLIVTPLTLICKTVLCVIAAHYDKKAVAQYIDRVHLITLYLVKFNSQLTTFFTIIFVTIVSTLVRCVALWRAQRGANVAELEQWQASISLPSTLYAVWSLRMYTTTSAMLVFLWSWYYLGSQASTREYKYQEAGNHIKTKITVTNPQGPSYLEEGYFTALSKSKVFATNTLFTSIFASSSGATDQGGFTGYDNNGLPLIAGLDSAPGKPDRDGFLQVLDPSQASFTSCVGAQTYAKFPGLYSLWGGRIIGALSFNTSFLGILCGSMRARNITKFPTGVHSKMTVLLNVSGPSDTSAQYPARFEVRYRNATTASPIRATSSLCNITMVPLQVKTKCTTQGCIVRKLKPIEISVSASYQTAFSNQIFAARFYDGFLRSTGLPSSLDNETAVEQVGWPLLYQDFLADGSPNDVTDLDILAASLPQNIEAAATAHGLTVAAMYQHWEDALESNAQGRVSAYITPLFNSYLAMYQQNGYALDSITSSSDNVEAVISGDVPSPWINVATFDGACWNPRYALSAAWIAVDLISRSVLLLAGVTAVYLRTRTLAPDIFGFVSSMTRDNPNVPLPHAASTLSGMERAKMMKHVKVQLADAEAHQDVGKVSLTSMNPLEQLENTAKLSKERRYI